MTTEKMKTSEKLRKFNGRQCDSGVWNFIKEIIKEVEALESENERLKEYRNIVENKLRLLQIKHTLTEETKPYLKSKTTISSAIIPVDKEKDDE